VASFRHYAAAIALTLVAASCGAETPIAPEDSVEEWHVLRDADDEISVRYPPGWDATSSALTDVVWPPHHLAIASFPLDAAKSKTGCSPVPVVNSLPPDSAFIILFEYTEGPVEDSPWVRDVPSRPAHFTLDIARFANYECYGPSYMIRFIDQGRVFQAHLSFCSDATDETQAYSLAVLDSLEIATRF
jgi:hypothetical protein